MAKHPGHVQIPTDPAEREAAGLDAALKAMREDEELLPVEDSAVDAPTDPAGAEKILVPVSDRQRIRLLLVTTDTSVFVEGSQLYNEYRELAEYFDELHIIVLSDRAQALPDSLRLAERAWVYATNSRSMLFAIYDAYRIAGKQLSFAAGFRADAIAATNPFEAGIVAYLVGRRYARPVQVHVSHNPFESYFVSEREGNNWRRLAARFVLPRADCLVARSERIGEMLTKRYRDRTDRLITLPPFRDLSFFRDAQPASDLHVRYPQFKFIILAIASLHARNKIDFAIDACVHTIRQYPTVGLVIVGDGPEQGRLKKRVLAAGVHNQVVFEPESEDVVSHLKTANLLISTATSEEADATLAAAAAAGLPVLTVAGGIADTLFEDKVNAFVCPADDMVCFQACIGEFLSNNQLRTTFSINSRSAVFSVVEQDAAAYRAAYAQAAESCVVRTFPGPDAPEQA